MKVRKKIRKSSDVPSSSCSCKSEKSCFSDVDLDWDEMFKEAFVTDVEVADLRNGIQVKNLFAFDK